MSMQNILRKEKKWLLGVLSITAVLTWAPYISLNVFNHVTWPIWRIPFVPIVVFDSGAYFEWIGLARVGYPAGDHIGLFVPIIHALGSLLPRSWSVAEVWLLTVWMSVALGLWGMARVMEEWGDLSVKESRVLACCAWASLVLPFMARPGVFTWYTPFYTCALLGIWRVHRYLKDGQYIFAGAGTLIAIGAAWVYPYFLVHVVVWLLIVWLTWLYQRSRRGTLILGGLIALGVPVGVIWMIPLLISRPNVLLGFELQERMGLAFSRIPVVSNSAFLVVMWGVFLLAVRWFYSAKRSFHERVDLLWMGWAALAVSWVSNIFTGVFIHNDHFRGPAAVFSWVSLACVYGLIRKEGEKERYESVSTERGARYVEWMVRGVFFVSAAWLGWYVVYKRYVFTGDHLNIVHVSHWLALMMAALLILWHKQGRKMKWWWVCLLAATLTAGLAARGEIFLQEEKKYSLYVPYVSVVHWISDHASVQQGVCTDPYSGEMLGAFTGRLVSPTFAEIALPKPDEEIIQRLKDQLAYYDAGAAKTEDGFIYPLDSMRGTKCVYQQAWANTLKRMGITVTEDVNNACPMERQISHEERIRRYIYSDKAKDEKAFQAICPLVAVAKDQRKYWTLPSAYKEKKIDENFSVWGSVIPIDEE